MTDPNDQLPSPIETGEGLNREDVLPMPASLSTDELEQILSNLVNQLWGDGKQLGLGGKKGTGPTLGDPARELSL